VTSGKDIGEAMKVARFSSLLTICEMAVLITVLPLPALAAGLHPSTHLLCESLETPIGIDAPAPRFSWQLDDTRAGAKQSAYEVQVATRPELLSSSKPDVWDSGRTNSGQSVAVPYGGPALNPETRYFWRVRAWDKDGAEYPASAVTWWETGLMNTEWSAKWISFELDESKKIRESGAEWITNRGEEHFNKPGDTRHDFRLSFTLDQPIKLAQLYVTGKDTAAAWINGKPVLQAESLPPYKQTPWKKYVERDVTSSLKQGKNNLSVEVTLYDVGENAPDANTSRSPMSACLYLEDSDGTSHVITSNETWKAEFNASEGWFRPDFDDSSWANAVPINTRSANGSDSEGRPWPTGPVVILRHVFEVAKTVRSARLYATALGSYRFWINGAAIGDQVLAPGWTDFRDHVPYQVYDITNEMKSGKNAIGAYLAPGWYSTPLEWTQQPNNYGKTPPVLRAQLRVEYSDGTSEWLNTDQNWKAAISPIEKAEIYDGETYDATKEQFGWSTASFNDADWKSIELIEPREPTVVAQDYQPIRVEKVLKAKALTEPKPGVYIFDFGQNMAGIEHLRVSGKAGEVVQLRFAEVLNPDGTIYTENLRTALATDHYTLGGKGTEEYEPSFTFHGFRYVELSGIAKKPVIDSVTAKVLHTDAPFSVELKTGSPMLNQLWSNILWGQRSNFVGVPTDCPQRDERLGWTGDAEVFWRAASYNMSLGPFSRKYAADLRATQVGTPMYGIYAPGTSIPNAGFGAGWSDAGVIVPWTSWLQSGDTRIIEQDWDSMTRYLAAIEENNPDFLWKIGAGIPFGDWLSPEGKTKAYLIQTAYWAYDVTLMKQMAHALGRSTEEQKYADLFRKIQTAFAAAYVRDDGYIAGADDTPSQFGRIFTAKPVPGGDTQTGYVLALYMNLVPTSLRHAAAERLVKKIESNGWKLGTGFLGTPYLLAALVDTGHADAAYRLLLNTDYPSWGYLVDHGATTMWERWNGDQMRGDPSMNSYNHYAYGAVADWIYRYAAGIDAIATDAGFHTIYLRPNFSPRLGSLNFSYASPYGEIHSAWKMTGPSVEWKLSIPANATAVLPVSAIRDTLFTLKGKSLDSSSEVHRITGTDGEKMYELAAGSYTFNIHEQTQNTATDTQVR